MRFFCVVLLLAGIFVSCASGPGIPGERKLITQNIAAEHYNIGEAYFELKNYAKAVEYYKKVVNTKAFARQAEYKLARSYVFLKQWNNALPLYHSLIAADPQNTNLAMSLGYVLASSGDIKAALALYTDLIAQDFFDSTLLQNMIILYLAAENIAEAERNFIVFKERFPHDEKIAFIEERIQKAKEPPEPENVTETPAETEPVPVSELPETTIPEKSNKKN